MTIKDSNSDGHFETRNTALAAYLRIEGFMLLDVEISEYSKPAVFIFESEPRIKECERLWQLNQSIGNLHNFHDSYRLCLQMVKVGKL